MSAPVIPPARQARTVASRKRLLEAVIACLVEVGYARTTTTLVAKRAGLSQGAVFKHFPTKALLLGAATEFLFADLVTGYQRAFADMAASATGSVEERLDVALDLLWQVFVGAPLSAAYELYVAARTDRELAGVLERVMANHARNLRAVAAQLFPESPNRDTMSEVVAGVMAGMQGAAITASFDTGSDDTLRFLRRAAKRDILSQLNASSRPS